MSTVETTRVSTIIETRFDIKGAEPIQSQYHKSRFFPDSVIVRTVDGQMTGATVQGPIVKKDGTASQQRLETYFSGSHRDEMPEWLRQLAESCEADPS